MQELECNLLGRMRDVFQALHADPEDVLTGRAAGRSVLITCCDTALGLQLAMHLSNVGFRVFAGLRSASPSAASEASDASNHTQGGDADKQGEEDNFLKKEIHCLMR